MPNTEKSVTTTPTTLQPDDDRDDLIWIVGIIIAVIVIIIIIVLIVYFVRGRGRPTTGAMRFIDPVSGCEIPAHMVAAAAAGVPPGTMVAAPPGTPPAAPSQKLFEVGTTLGGEKLYQLS